MNTSKEAEKKSAKGKLPETDFDNPPELTEEDNELMKNEFAAPAEIKDDAMKGIFETLENPETQMREVTANYLDLTDFAEGEVRPFVFTGKTSFTTDKTNPDGSFIVKDAVTLMDKHGKNWICASTVIVSALFKVEKIPAGCKIQYNGKVKGKNGSYHDCKVFVV